MHSKSNDARPAIGSYGFNTSGMNTSVLPGDNFYNFSVGTYVSEMVVPPDEMSWNPFIMLSNKVASQTRAVLESDQEAGKKTGLFYASYMNTDLLEKLDVSAFM